MKNNCYINGIGAYAPKRILTNEDLSKLVDTTDEWITTRTGIKQRHVLDDAEQISDMGVKAAQIALAKAQIDIKEITHILVATTTSEYLCPATATIIANKLGCTKAMAFDFNAACTGFLYGLALAQGFLANDANAKILLVCAEALTRKVNWQDRGTCVLFGDGAGAILLSKSTHNALAVLDDVSCYSDGSLQNLITIGGGSAKAYSLNEPVGDEFFLHMQGREVFKHAVRNLTAVCNEILEKNNLSVADVALFVPHQANLRIIEAVGSRLHIDATRVFTNVQKYGNTSSASVPIALCEAMDQNLINSGGSVLVCAVGAGFTWGAGLLKFI